MKWTDMINVLNCYRKQEILTVYLKNGVIIDGFVDTISESCTCELEEDNPDYQEYYMCALEITDIIEIPEGILFEESVGDLIELSICNEPQKIIEKGKGVIWRVD